MKVSIIGHGFVGKALENSLKEGTNSLIIDPIYRNKVEDIAIYDPDFIFICVPTPMKNDGNQDLEILHNVICQLNNIHISAEIILKSTVLPNAINSLKSLMPDIIYNPEFLTEKNANQDFINSELILFGGESKNTQKISSFYNQYTKCKSTNHIHTDLISASLIKYTINSFLASKVIFFNELFNLFNKSGTKETWQNFIEAVSLDSRIGKSHMQVPGPDGRFGYGGACFPKDTKALFKYSISVESPFEILKKVIDINDEIRGAYDSATDREVEQNISFYNED